MLNTQSPNEPDNLQEQNASNIDTTKNTVEEQSTSENIDENTDADIDKGISREVDSHANGIKPNPYIVPNSASSDDISVDTDTSKIDHDSNSVDNNPKSSHRAESNGNDTSNNDNEESYINNKINGAKRRINTAKDNMGITARNGIKRYGDSIKSAANGVKHTVTDPITNAADHISNKYDKVTGDIGNLKDDFGNLKNDVKNAKGFKNKAGTIGNFAGDKIKNSKAYKNASKKFSELTEKIKKLATLAKPILIGIGIFLAVRFVIIFGISVYQSIAPTPHYYCDLEADDSLKATEVYQQYCSANESFKLDNLNGHYIIQDGSGPCTDCATANMLMRYYTAKGINFFDYLWDEQGQYSGAGQSLQSEHMSGPTTLRHHINGNLTTRANLNISGNRRNTHNGAVAFASKNGINGWTMANWGYLRDQSLDLKEYEQTDDYYLSNIDSTDWVFDLSVSNNGPGSTWAAHWEGDLTIDGQRCHETTAEGSSITGEDIKFAFMNPLVNKDAGVLLYYEYGKGNRHAILLTKYENGVWYGIDSALGLAGGYEGPMDGSGHFVWQDTKVKALLDSGKNSEGGLKIIRICYISNLGI